MQKRTAMLCAIGMTAMTAFAKPYAIFHTEKGDIVAELFADKAPKTVENFIGLAKGTKTWTHPGTNEVMTSRPLYSNTKFHRTIPGFMIQGGDPMGSGMGGPGYTIKDEFNELPYDRPGRLAMAHTMQPNSGGSQFFITVAPYPSLNEKYTLFGQVVSGQDIADAISNMPSEPGGGKALNPVTLKSVEIVDQWPVGGGAKGAATSGTK